MSKDAWTRLEDTLKYVDALLGNGPMQHIAARLPDPQSAACDVLSDRLSLGARGLGEGGKAESEKRRAKRSYMLGMILLEGRDDAFVQQAIHQVETGYTDVAGAHLRYNALVQQIWKEYDKTVDCDTLRPQLGEMSGNLLEFMKKYSVLPCHGDVKAAGGDYDLLTIDGTGPDPLVHNMILSPSGANEYCFKLNYAPRTKQVQGVPFYFLPWKSARLVGMQLGNAANFFFTAAINGCSVFMTGNAQTPTVYHAGINPPWPPMGANCNAHVTAAKAGPQNAAGVALVWRELFFQRSGEARTSTTFGEVNKAHYVNDDTPDGANFTTNRVHLYHTGLSGAWGAAGFDIQSCSPWGCVFGVRDTGTGDWTFYLQENATFIYISGGKGWGTARVVRVSKFWPRLPVWEYSPPTRARLPVPGEVTIQPM